MRMTDKILITLRDLSNEQKSILSGKFIEQSKWLESELQSLKNLILQDPRENFQLTQTIKTAVEETDEIPAPSSSMPERNQAQKRKSPEVALSLIRDSPEQKRSTPNIEWENVATHFGVPSDLNKLKKEELLVMLEGYGIYSQSMKDYKKDIMNALKNHLELEYCSSIRNGNGIGNENVNGADMFTESHEIVRLEPEPQRSQEQIEEKSKIPSQPKEEDLAIPVTSSQEQNVQVSAEEEVKLEPTMESIPDVDNHTLSPMETQPSEIEVAENSNAIIVETLKPYVDQMLAKKPPVVPVKNSGFVDKPIIPALEKARQLRELEEAKALEKKKIEDVKADKLRQIEELRQRKNNPSTVISSGVTKPAPLEKTLPKANIVPPMPPSTASNFATPNGFQNVQKKPIQNVLNIFQKKSETMPSTTPVQSPAITTSSITSSENSKIVYVSKDSPISQPEKLSPPEGKSEDVVRGTENMPISNAPQIEAPVPSKVLPAIESMSSSVNINTATIDTKLPSIQTSDVVTAPVTVEIPPKQEILVPVSEIQIPAHVSVETRIVSPPSVMPAVEEDFEEEYEIASRGSADSDTTDPDADAKVKQKIPDWARGSKLKEALDRQYGLSGGVPMDPDLIFPEVQTCSLEEIFGATYGKAGQYSKRTSSAQWDQDELTVIEKRNYRTQMGYTKT